MKAAFGEAPKEEAASDVVRRARKIGGGRGDRWYEAGVVGGTRQG